MATLSISKSYADGTIFYEADLDNFKDALETLLNTTKLSNSNFQSGSITSSNISQLISDNVYIETNSGTLQIKDASITSIKLPLTARYGLVGRVRMFYTYNSTVSIPRGWMLCDGSTINQTNYDAIHGAGAYVADGVGSSAISGNAAPNLVSKFVLHSGTSTAHGTTTGSDTVDYEHNHQWWERTSASNSDQYFNGAATATNFPGGSTDASRMSFLVETTTDIFSGAAVIGGTNDQIVTTNGGSATLNIVPEYISVLYIIKVV